MKQITKTKLVLRPTERLVHVTIRGRTPLMMHRPAALLDTLKNPKGKMSTKAVGSKVRDPIAEAEAAAYKLPSGELYIPFEWIYGTTINGGSRMKEEGSRRNIANLIAGGVRILPLRIPLGTDKYEIDQSIVHNENNNARLPCYRPRLEEWGASFDLIYDSALFKDGDILRQALSNGGIYFGIGSARPQHRMPFGTFDVVGWKEA